jgi:ABC-type uncharacterized transport system permease subunit
LKLPQVNLPWRQMIVVVVMVVLALTMMNLNSRLSEYSRLSGDRDQLATQVGALEVTKMALQTQLAYVGSEGAVVDEARGAHMVREGENLIVVLTPSGNTVVTPEAVEEIIQPPQPWEVWMALFFGQ